MDERFSPEVRAVGPCVGCGVRIFTKQRCERIQRAMQSVPILLSGLSGDVVKGERLHATRTKTRCGCFLPDLTGLARRTPATTSRVGIYDELCGSAMVLDV
jgi:hypothetical protein